MLKFFFLARYPAAPALPKNAVARTPGRRKPALACGALLLGLCGFAPQAAHAALPTLAVNDVSIDEGQYSAALVKFTVTLSEPSAVPVTVKYNTSDLTAVAPDDYTAKAPSTLKFAPGETTKAAAVAVKGDVLDEADEKFTVKLTAPTNATVQDGSGTCTIIDDDTSYITGLSPTVYEGDSGTTILNFTLAVNTLNSRDVSVKVQTTSSAAPAATPNTDYIPVNKVVTIPAGQNSIQVPVEVKGDLLNEENEKIGLALSNPVNTTLGSISPATIRNDDYPPGIFVDDVSVTEGKTLTNATFHITLDGPSGLPITAHYQTLDGTATAGPDYTAIENGSVTFTPGQTSKTVNVVVKGDLLDESDETFSLKIVSAPGTSRGDYTGTGTILDDDTSTLSVFGEAVNEGDEGTGIMKFRFTLSGPSSHDITFKAKTVDSAISPATAGVDYTAYPLTALTIPVGETALIINVPVFGDLLNEENERVALQISSLVNATLGSNFQGNIVNDDPLPKMNISDALINETTSAQIARVYVTLSEPSGRPVTVQYVTADLTATAPADYTAKPLATLTFAPGETSKQVAVAVKGDTVTEGNEQFKVALSNNTLSQLMDNIGIVTIAEGDNQPPDAVEDFFFDDEEFREVGDSIDVTLDVLENDSDPEGNQLSLVSVTNLDYQHGSDDAYAEIINDKVHLVLPTLVAGTDTVTFDYTVTDGIDTSTATAEFDMRVSSFILDRYPVLVDDEYSAPQTYQVGDTLDATVDVLANDYDPDGEEVVLSSVSGPTGDFQGQGTVEIVEGQVHVLAPNLIRGGSSVSFNYSVKNPEDDFGVGRGTATIFFNLDESGDLRATVKTTAPSGNTF